ncbi:fibronectin type III-like domain-contianing protein, partial [Pseudonocardia abyssalis]
LPLALGPDHDRPFLPPLGRVATWDLRLAERMAASTARALRAAGLFGHLVPAGSGADRGTDASGPPAVSDPVLAATFAAARVHGAQGRTAGRTHLIDEHHVAVIAPLGVWPDGHWHERVLRTHLLAAAEAAVRAGAAAVVPSPASNAGVPTHTDVWLLRDVLRREWHFGGSVLAHPGAVGALETAYRIADGPDQAVALAMEAGVDVVGGAQVERLVALVCSGALSSWLLDDAVAAVLTVKSRLGLVAPAPATAPSGADDDEVGPAEETAARVARTAFTRSLVLLADPNAVLPLRTPRIVDVVPGTADSPDAAGLARALDAVLTRSLVRDGRAPWPEPGDVVVVVSARPEDAVRVAEGAVAAGRRCIVVVTGDRVHTLAALAATTATVLVCWRPLGEHARLLADVLTGRAEPAGRLPLALPGPAGGTAPVFPLGHGTGYTSFEYSRLAVTPAVLDGGDVVRVRCSVTNTGQRRGREVVQVYLANPTGRTVVTPEVSLAAFSTVEVAAGQTLPVTIRLPLARLAVWNRTMHHILEPGTVDVLVGRSAVDIRLRGTVTVAAHPSRRQP